MTTVYPQWDILEYSGGLKTANKICAIVNISLTINLKLCNRLTTNQPKNRKMSKRDVINNSFIVTKHATTVEARQQMMTTSVNSIIYNVLIVNISYVS